MTTHYLRYLFSAIVILAGIILILCGMNYIRALYLIIFGICLIPSFTFSAFHNIETPKGVKFWARKVLDISLGLMAATSLSNFLIPNNTYELKGVIIWLCAGIICGILLGTFDYFAHNTGGDEAGFEAKRRQQQEMGKLYDKIVEEMNSENK